MLELYHAEPMANSLKALIGSAYDRTKYLSVSYVGLDNRPELSFRGSVQVYSDTQLAVWARNPEGGLQKAMDKNPHIALLYGDFTPGSYAVITFRGRGHIDKSDAARRKVYESAAKGEQDRDKDRKGDALIIDLDNVDGFFAGGVLKMKR